MAGHAGGGYRLRAPALGCAFFLPAMTTPNPAPRNVALRAPSVAAARRLYALNLCRHCGCFAHLTLRAAARQPGFPGPNGAVAAFPESMPHPLGDRAGRIAYARLLESRCGSDLGDDPVVMVRLPAVKTPARPRPLSSQIP
jgi:hypothetical protein